MYTLEKWIKYHGEKVDPKEYEVEFDKWLKWRQAVDQGKTRTQIMTIVRGEVGYESPTTGEIITSDKARREDLAKSGCIEYDPEMRTDHKNRIKNEEEKLDREVDEGIDRAISQLSSEQKVKLEVEMDRGMDAEIVRETV